MSTTIAASLVKELRDQTGAGMMDCKRALEETGGDLDAARTLLREKGVADAAKRSGRDTTEGKVGYSISEESVAAMVAVGCETEPVSNNEDFLVYAQRVLGAVLKDGVERRRLARGRARRARRPPGREHRRGRSRALRRRRARDPHRVRPPACQQARRAAAREGRARPGVQGGDAHRGCGAAST